MAESILFGLCTKILEKLGSALLQEIGSLFGVKDELAKLDDTVSAIKAKLLDAEERSNQSHEVKHWLKKLKDVLYDVDDLLDAYSTKILQRNAMSGNRMTKEVRDKMRDVKLSREIRSVKEELDAIAKGMSSFNFRDDQKSESPVDQRRETHSFVDASASVIIGREHDKEEVIKLLSEANENENVSTVAIVGLGGLGKTTLAQLVFNDKDFSADFELKDWVHVSEIFDVKMIAQKILGFSSSSGDLETLQQELRKKIDEKKYLLVLDDLWNEDHEDLLGLKTLLGGGARGSRILVTTRSKKVAASAQSIRSYELKGLNEDDSWSLFSKMVLGPRNESEVSIFQDIGREIVKKCVGVPLAIRSIGRVLSFKTTESAWLRVKNEFANVNASIRKDLQVLKLSYDHLPSHLKNCFAYCSLFPKGCFFEKKTLIQLWIAQGYVESSWDDQHLEDAGDEYLSELLWRSFFSMNDFGNTVHFTMHDLMYDLARLVAGTECSISEIVDVRTRHVSLMNSIGRPSGSSLVFPIGLLKAKTRTLILPKLGADLDRIFSTFRRLRVLDLRGSKFKSLPDSIGKLKHLRFLHISNNNLIEKLPRCIEKLQNLQTLKLSYCENLLELPSEIRKIASLRHIEIDGCYRLKHMPHGLGQLTSLQTLSLFVVGNSPSFASRQGAGLWELNTLNNLRGELMIRRLENAAIASNDVDSYLKEKQSLESLILSWNDDQNVDDSDMLLEALQPHPNLKEVEIKMFGGLKIPNWISSLRNVVSIQLKSCRRCQHIPNLDHLLCLKNLLLQGLPALEYISSEVSDSVTTSTTFFPSLERLELRDCENLRGWWKAIDVEIPQFERLSRLVIVNCPNLTSMPLFPFLEILKLENASPKPLRETVTMLEKNMAAAPSKMSRFYVSGVEDLKSHLDQWLQCFPSLDTLYISDCPGLTFLPPHLKHLCSLDYLYIENAEDLDPSRDNNGEEFQWQHLTSLLVLTLSGLPKMVALPSALQHATTLRVLSISSCPNLKALPEWLPNLASLSYLSLSGLPKMVALPSALQHVTTLRELRISSCPTLEALPEWLPNLTSLSDLTLSGLPKMVALPSVLQHITTLQRLFVSECPTLKALPEWLPNLNALQLLELRDCPELKSMPDGMPRLTSLRNLHINNCGELSKRCRKSEGEDWPKIAHVQHIGVDDNGCGIQ